MKYGESAFDIIYLVFAVVMGIRILKMRKGRAGTLAGSAVLILGLGDAFHLVPRVLNYFLEVDLTVWLGFGKLVTSITMTVFYLLMVRLWAEAYGEQADRRLYGTVWALVALRVLLCLLPQNHWFRNEGSVLWGVLRNLPFVAHGAIVIRLYYTKRAQIARFRPVWLLIALSFLFYIPVAVAAPLVPMLGMLMLPKTVCYMILIVVLAGYVKER